MVGIPVGPCFAVSNYAWENQRHTVPFVIVGLSIMPTQDRKDLRHPHKAD